MPPRSTGAAVEGNSFLPRSFWAFCSFTCRRRGYTIAGLTSVSSKSFPLNSNGAFMVLASA
jgi:hypothetical protein